MLLFWSYLSLIITNEFARFKDHLQSKERGQNDDYLELALSELSMTRDINEDTMSVNGLLDSQSMVVMQSGFCITLWLILYFAEQEEYGVIFGQQWDVFLIIQLNFATDWSHDMRCCVETMIDRGISNIPTAPTFAEWECWIVEGLQSYTNTSALSFSVPFHNLQVLPTWESWFLLDWVEDCWNFTKFSPRSHFSRSFTLLSGNLPVSHEPSKPITDVLYKLIWYRSAVSYFVDSNVYHSSRRPENHGRNGEPDPTDEEGSGRSPRRWRSCHHEDAGYATPTIALYYPRTIWTSTRSR